MWLNEGVCGVFTSDNGWRYYDVAGPGGVGKGGWSTPKDKTDNNLWYEPPPDNGPVIFELVDEVYGTWDPQATPPYNAEATQDLIWLIEVTGVENTGDDYSIEYRTEGVKDVGIKVRIRLLKEVNGQWVEVDGEEQAIAQKWDNLQSVTFTIAENGAYKATAEIQTASGQTLFSTWNDDLGMEFSRP
ncbi:MAG: hypothetical protein JW889_00865 [Verrucomicrobia bacterium]|nr:hypothetical protein [Verrucomicrobiota bacterium]